MSVCRKLPDGTIQKIAGHTILLDANASEVRHGTWSIPAATSPGMYAEGTVTFTDPMPDTDYMVVIEGTGYSYSGGDSQRTDWKIGNKTVTGFTIGVWMEVSAEHLSVCTGEYWAWKPVKIEGYTALQNKVNSPDDTPTIDSMNLVTSDGVARAIENASAVWKGTKAEWNALPATEKQTYDLAVLLDETLVKAVDREDGTETDVANLNKIVHLTKAEYDAMPSHDPDTYYMITDDTTTTSPGYPRPDWANAVSITAAQLNAGYTAPSDGMLVGYVTATNNSDITLNVNGVPMGKASYLAGKYVSWICLSLPVCTNDVITKTGLDSVNDSTEMYSLHFVPWK